MYERFTDRARKVMQLAHQDAQRSGQEFISTQHIFLALLAVGRSVATEVLDRLNADAGRVRREIERMVLAKQHESTSLPVSALNKVVEYAMEEARNLGHGYVGSEHLLIGLMRIEDGVAARTLANLGLTLELVRAQVVELIEPPFGSPTAQRAAEPPTAAAEYPAEIAAQIDRLQKQKETAVAAHDFETAGQLRDQIVQIKNDWLAKQLSAGEPPQTGRSQQPVEKYDYAFSSQPAAKREPKYSRFTTRAKEIIHLALEESQRLGHKHVGTEHLLIGLVSPSVRCSDSRSV